MPTDDLESFQYLFSWFTTGILRYHKKMTPGLERILKILSTPEFDSHQGKLVVLGLWDEPIFKDLMSKWNRIAVAASYDVQKHEEVLLRANGETPARQEALDELFLFSKGVYDQYLTTGFDFLKKMDKDQAW